MCMYHHIKYKVFILDMFRSRYWIYHVVVAKYLSYTITITHTVNLFISMMSGALKTQLELQSDIFFEVVF